MSHLTTKTGMARAKKTNELLISPRSKKVSPKEKVAKIYKKMFRIKLDLVTKNKNKILEKNL